VTKAEMLATIACSQCGFPCPKHEITYRARRFCSVPCVSDAIDDDEDGDWLDRPLTTAERATDK
jgi:hypothetical protein